MSSVPQLRLLLLIRSEYGRQYLFAERVGISEAQLSRILSGRTQPGPKLKAKIAQAFGMEFEEVFD